MGLNEVTLSVEKTPEQIRQEDLQRLSGFRIIDDTFARSVFKGNPELAEFVLRIITRLDDLVIDETTYDTQYDAKRLAGSRSLILDVHGSDVKGRKYDMEMEKWDASPERAEFHVATMLVEHLHKGDSFSNLPETYVIFVCEKDVIGNGRAVNQFSYRNDDLFLENAEVEKHIAPSVSLNGKTRILFVNGSYTNIQTDIGKLIHDLKCSQPGEMYFKNLADRAQYLKKHPKGVEEMCKVMDDLRKESEERGAQKKLIQDIQFVMDSFGVSAERAMESLHVPQSQQAFYARAVHPQFSKPDF